MGTATSSLPEIGGNKDKNGEEFPIDVIPREVYEPIVVIPTEVYESIDVITTEVNEPIGVIPTEVNKGCVTLEKDVGDIEEMETRDDETLILSLPRSAMTKDGEATVLETKVDIKEDDDVTDSIYKCVKLRMCHILVVLTLCVFIAVVTWRNYDSGCNIDAFKEYGIFFALAMYVMSGVPYLSLPAAFANCIGLLLHNPYDKVTKTSQSPSTAPFVSFRMVTRGDFPKLVTSNALFNKNICQAFGLKNFVIEIVSDKPINYPSDDSFVREIIVPKSYKTKNNTLFKARALNYCLEKEVNQLAKNDWIVHLDEETRLSEPALFGIHDFITANRADIGQGAISYANGDVIQNWFTTMADSIRLAFDYAIFRFTFATMHTPAFGLKGSYVVLRNSVETDVGLDFGPKGSIAEDCHFALCAWEKGYAFDFIPGELKEKSPFTVMDFIRQRKRWFVGQMYVLIFAGVPFYYKAALCLSLVSAALMPFSLLGVVLSFVFRICKPLLLNILTSFIGGTFGFLYAFGAFMSFSERGWSVKKRILVSLVNCIFVLPLAAAAECTAIVWGLFTLNNKEFVVINKEASTTNRSRFNVLSFMPNMSLMRRRNPLYFIKRYILKLLPRFRKV